MAKYAENTSVSQEKSRAEIETTLNRYGATSFMYGWEDDRAVIGFEMERRRIRFVIQMPDINDDEFQLTPAKKYERHPDDARKAWEQAGRQRWRALALAVKAKLESVEAEIATFEQEFMAHIVMPDGKTVAEHISPKIEEAYLNGKMPRMLPAFSGEE